MKLRFKATAVAIGLMVSVVASSLSGCASSNDADGGGDVLRVNFANIPWTEKFVPMIPEFEKEFGVTVEVTQLGDVQLMEQLNVKLNAGATDIDVIMFRPMQETRMFASNGWLSDLGEYIHQDADWEWEDFNPAAIDAAAWDGKVVSVPIVSETYVLYYRKDLLQQLGLEVPSTLVELEAAAKAIKENFPGVAGFTARTAVSPVVVPFSSWLYSEGGDWRDANGDSAIGTPEARSAYDLFSRMLREYGPDNVTTDMNWTESLGLFAQGLAGFSTEGDSLFPNVTNPESSKVSESVGFAPFPAGKAGSRPSSVPAFVLGVNEFSLNKDLSWKFIQWATSKERVLELQKQGVLGARTSVWETPESLVGYPEGLADAILANQKNGVGHDRPTVFNVARSREIVGNPIVVGISGGDIDAAIKQANTDFQALIDEEKKDQ
jgi:multiple sugar transport system substrate-binding protein